MDRKPEVKIKPSHYHNKAKLGLVALLFAVLGGYFVMRSFAATESQLTCTLHATSSASLSSAFASAPPNAVICLSTGTYSFSGNIRTGLVTIQPESGAAPVVDVTLNPASNITFDGIKVSEMFVDDSRTKNITLKNSTITGQITFRTGDLANANILLDHDVIRDFNATGSGGEGRIWLPENTNQPSGITIQYSEFTGGMSDGIQNGSNGTVIQYNEFHDMVEGSSGGVHTDAIQLYGSKNTVIRGNYFHDVPDAIMAPDGTDHEIIEDNVFKGANDAFGYPFAITLYSDDSSVVQHNTMADGSCTFNLRCGIIRIGNKGSCSFSTECDQSHGTVIKDNIIGEISCCDAGANTGYTLTNNLIRSGSTTNNTAGSPNYSGGTAPSTWGGFALASGSPGKNSASDGTDVGARYFGPVSSSGGGTSKIGDFNGDNVVNIYDLGIFLSKWQTTSSSDQDLNTDGTVNIYDLGIFLSHYGS